MQNTNSNWNNWNKHINEKEEEKREMKGEYN